MKMIGIPIVDGTIFVNLNEIGLFEQIKNKRKTYMLKCIFGEIKINKKTFNDLLHLMSGS